MRAEEIVIQLPDGATVTTLVNATPIHSEDGEIVSVVVTNQDITPLEELERLRAEFLGVVSHELRAPLTTIKGSAATVLRSPSPLDPVEARQFFRIIDEQADQMRDLINDLLDLSRIESGNLSVAPEPTEVAAVIEQARNAFLSSGAGNAVAVEVVPALPRIGADRQRVAQVLYNLFANASRYSPEASAITVAAYREDQLVAVSVTDRGIGVSPEDLPHLFSKFSRIDRGEGRWPVGGHGLGLAICKGIVEAHGGRIWAESAGPGCGARFTFTIPVVDEAVGDRAADPAAGGAAGPPPTERERILAVDDDPQILRYIRRTLSEAGYTPIVTADPEEMVPLLAAERPHLVLLNLVLPGTDGFELMRRIPHLFDAPVIFLSGRGRDQDIARAFEIGRRRLRGQALLAHRAGGPHPGGPAQTGAVPAARALRAGRPGHRPRGTPGDGGGPPGGAYRHRVPAPLRAGPGRRPRPDPRPALPADLGAARPGGATAPSCAPSSGPSAGSWATTPGTPPTSSPCPASATAWPTPHPPDRTWPHTARASHDQLLHVGGAPGSFDGACRRSPAGLGRAEAGKGLVSG